MAPSVTTSPSNGHVSVNVAGLKATNGKNGNTKSGARHASSAEVIQMEHQFGAHNYHPLPVVFERAQGAKVWDPEGREYIDMLSAYSAVNQVSILFAVEEGHCHPRIAATLIEQYHRNVWLARKWAYAKKGVPEGKAMVLCVENNFHGRTLGIISMSTDPESRTGFGPYLEGVGPTFVDGSQERTIRYGIVEDLERALELHGKYVAAFLIEPIQGEAGIVVPELGYLAQVHAVCKKHNVLLICDEIQTGLCRTGKMLDCEYDNVRPDVVLLGKALSGGMYPVSAVLADRDIMLCIKPGEHGSTYGGNPLGCAVAMTALQVLQDEKLAERAMALGGLFRSSVSALNSPLVQIVRGRGLLNAVVIDESKSTKGRTAWQLCLLLKSRGVLAKPTHVNIIRFAPPLVISEEDLLKSVKVLGECLNDLDKLDVIPGEDDF
ncbi:ornithine aminotransferase [Lentinula edodes]|uniref:Ornithine aminotransferase n=1 Tax=Lentinula edodes TaxID=5353 RepID=A0A1Q3EHU0_LENED|nr:ornithine aminotransferase [Lentinula edodes]